MIASVLMIRAENGLVLLLERWLQPDAFSDSGAGNANQ
jgi:hypothetical protein